MKTEESFSTNLTKFYIASLLRKRPCHGYEIISDLGKILGKKPSAGQIYPLLGSMAKKKLVTVREKRIDGRKRKVYALTPAGKKFVAQLMQRFEEIAEIAIEPNLSKCGHCGCSVYKGGYESEGKMYCCSSCANAC